MSRMLKPCRIKDCTKTAGNRTGGVCYMHRNRIARHGDPDQVQRPLARSCSIEGCGRPHFGRGWCRSHYVRWYDTGDPLTPRRSASHPGTPVEAEAAFWAKVDVGHPLGCWLWTGGTSAHGYGIATAPHLRTKLAHRIAFILLCGEIPAGMTLDHLCRIRACVNPDHLEPVTQSINTKRGASPVVLQGRAAKKRGDICRHGHSLDDAYVRPSGHRECRTCRRDQKRRFEDARRGR